MNKLTFVYFVHNAIMNKLTKQKRKNQTRQENNPEKKSNLKKESNQKTQYLKSKVGCHIF